MERAPEAAFITAATVCTQARPDEVSLFPAPSKRLLGAPMESIISTDGGARMADGVEGV